MNLFNLFSKYYKQLPLIRKTVTDNNRLLVFDPSNAQHLFSLTKNQFVYLHDCGCHTYRTQHDYYKTSNGNYVEIMRFLDKKSNGQVFIYKNTEKILNDNYTDHIRCPDEVKLIIDNYHRAIEYTEL